MLQLSQLLRILTELAFVLLGLLLVQVGVMGRFGFDRRSPFWYGAAALVIWFGLKALLNAGRYTTKWQHRIRGGSLALLGGLMLAISWAPVSAARPLVFAAGVALIVRGLASTVLVLRSP